MTPAKPRVVILGAGVAGLSAAYHLTETGAFDVTVLEKTDRVGGLATSFKKDSAVFDFGPHAFHSQEPHIIEFFQKLMAGRFREIEKDVCIKFHGQFYPYPLNPAKALRNMPIATSLKCGASYFWNLFTNFKPVSSLKTAEEFFVRNFGWQLYRIFFEGYTHKVWGIHPRHLSAKFISNRLPSANLLRIAWTALTGADIKIKKPHEVPLKLRIFYPDAGSIAFPEAMKRAAESRGAHVELNAQVTAIECADQKARAICYQSPQGTKRLECDRVVSTIPLPELIQKCAPSPPAEVLEATRHLQFRPILIVCLLINKESIFKYQTIYYTNRLFNRLAQMNSYSDRVTPHGTCGITAELTCRTDDALWKMSENELAAKVIADMVDEGLIQVSDVKATMVLRNEHGYPIYDEGFETHLMRLRKFVHEIPNLYISGRQGMFNYAQMHYGVSSGMQLAKHLEEGRGKPDLATDDMEGQYFV